MKFYADAFGWRLTDMAEGAYARVVDTEGNVVGLFEST